MTQELTALTLSALLQVIQFGLMSIPANRELGRKNTLGARDGPPLTDKMSPTTARLYRALGNHFEGLILFSIAVFVVTLSNQNSWFTATCAWIYLIARVFYIPAYAFGLVPWRSIVWMIGFAATTFMLLAALI